MCYVLIKVLEFQLSSAKLLLVLEILSVNWLILNDACCYWLIFACAIRAKALMCSADNRPSPNRGIVKRSYARLIAGHRRCCAGGRRRLVCI